MSQLLVRSSLTLLIAAFGVVVITSVGASADTECVKTESGYRCRTGSSVDGQSTGGGVGNGASAAADPAYAVTLVPLCTLGDCSSPACPDGQYFQVWHTYPDGSASMEGVECITAAEQENQPPVVTSAVVLRAIRDLHLPGSTLEIQPAKGETAVHYPTNFYTMSGSFSRDITLLGQGVHLEITPSRFEYVFGDGESMPTASKGAPYPELDVTHEYEKAHVTVRPRIRTWYTATFQVENGPEQDVVGEVGPINGLSQELRIIEIDPTLTGMGYD